MLTHGANVNAQGERGWTPLLYAIYWHRLKTARLLLEHGADANAKSEYGQTPLICAFESPALIRLLLEHGADVNA